MEKDRKIAEKDSKKYAWTATVGEKGQIVIPKQAREIFGISPGDTLLILGDSDRGLAILPQAEIDRFYATVLKEESK